MKLGSGVAWFAVLMSLAACDTAIQGSRPDETDQLTQSADADALPFDLADVVHRAQLSYTFDGSAIAGGRPTYAVRAERGVVALTPKSFSDEEVRAQAGAPVEFETVLIARGAPFELGSAESYVAEDGTLHIDRGIAEERFENSEEYVEQSWIFDAVPQGKGDLIVRVRAGGESYAGWSEDGHHFIDEASGIGVVYSNASWIDARGRETAVPVTFENGELVLTVPESIVRASAYPATLDPIIGVESGTSNAGGGPAAYTQESPSVATDGTNYFVVWSDLRNGSNRDIYGARVRALDGAILDATSIPISTQPFDQLRPVVAWNGSHYLVVWGDGRSGGTFDLYAQRINADGTLAGGEISLTPSIGGSQIDPSISNADSTFVVTWTDARTGTNTIRLARVTDAGASLDGTGRALFPGTIQGRSSVSCTSSQCLVAWQDGPTTNENIRVLRTNPTTGVNLDAAPLDVSAVPGRDLNPAVAHDASNYLVVYRRSGDIFAKRVSQTLTSTVIDANELVISNAANSQITPAVDFDGSQFFVVWQDSRTNSASFDIYGTRVTSAGVVGDPTGRLISAAADTQTLPAIVFGATRHFVVWQDNRAGVPDIYGARVFTTGSVFDASGLAVSKSGSRQFGAAAIFDGARFFVVFADSRASGDGDYDIKGMRVNRGGVVLDPTGINIAIAPGVQTGPAVAFSGTQILVVWRDTRNGATNPDIYGARLTTGYSLRDPSGFQITSAADEQAHPAVAYNPAAGQFLVVWDDLRNRTTTSTDIYGVRIATDGASPVLSPGVNGFPISTAAGIQERPDVAANATIWVVAWADRRNFATTAIDLYGNGVTAGGALIGADFPLSTASGNQQSVRLAFNGLGDFFAVWADDRNGNSDIFGSRITTGPLSALDPGGIPMASSTLGENRPAIALTGTAYFVVWRQQQSAGSQEVDLFGRQFGLDGSPQGTAAYEVSGPTTGATAGNEDQPAIAVNTANNTLVAYQRFRPEDQRLRSERIRTRRVQLP